MLQAQYRQHTMFKSKLMNLKFFKIYTCVFTGKTWILSIYMYLGTLLVKLQ